MTNLTAPKGSRSVEQIPDLELASVSTLDEQIAEFEAKRNEARTHISIYRGQIEQEREYIRRAGMDLARLRAKRRVLARTAFRLQEIDAP